MMKKRFLIGFLVLFAIMAMCVGLVGCRGDSQEHTLTRHEAKEATCTEEGNIEYWECSHCDKLFADAEGKIPVTSVVVPKKAHTIPDDAYHAPVPSGCETDGTLAYWECTVCHGKFANQAGTKELTSIVDPAAHVLMAHKQESPTFTEPGKKAYYECSVCGKEFLDENAETAATEENTRIEPLGEETVEVSVTLQDTDGTPIESDEVRVRLTLQNAAFEKTYGADKPITVTDGKLDLNKIGAGEYKAVVTNNNSYFEAPLVIEKGVGTANLTLVKTKHIVTQCDTIAARNDDGEAFVFTTPWKDGETAPSVSLVNPDAITGKNYFVEFMVNTTGWTDYTSRIGIAIAGSAEDDSLTGFVLFTSGNVTETFRVKPGFKFDSAEAEDYAVLANGAGQGTNIALDAGELRMRAVRDGGKAYLYTYTNNEWQKLLEYKVADELEAAVVFGARISDSTGEVVLSEISYGKYHAQTVTSEKITLAYFEKDGKIYTTAGLETTLSELEVLPLSNIVLTLNTLNGASLEDKNVTLTSQTLGTLHGTVEDGNKVILQNVYAGKYVLQIEDYIYSYNVNIAETCEADVTVERLAYTYGDEKDLSVGVYGSTFAQQRGCDISESDPARIVVKTIFPTSNELTINTGAIGSTDFVMQFHVAAENFNSLTTWLGIRVAEGSAQHDTVGVVYCWQESGGNHVFKIADLYHAEGMSYYNANAHDAALWKQYVNLVTEQMLKDGIDMRIVRKDGKVTMLIKISGEWQELYTATLTNASADAKISFCFSGGGTWNDDEAQKVYCTHTFTDFTITALGTVAPLSEAELTLNTANNASLEGKKVTLTSQTFGTVQGTVGEGNKVILQNVYAGKYVLQIEDYIYSYNVNIAETCEADVTVERLAYTYGDEKDLSVGVYGSTFAQQRGCDISESDPARIVVKTIFPTSNELTINTGAIGSTDFVMQFHVAAENFNSLTTWLGIRVAEGSAQNDVVGVLYCWQRSGTNELFRVRELYHGEGMGYYNANAGSGWTDQMNVVTEQMLKDGVDMRIVRKDGKVTMLIKISGEWQELYTATLTNASADAKISFCFSGGGTWNDDEAQKVYCTHTFTDFTITALE